MALLDDVKAALRVTTTDAGILTEITDLIAAAKADMGLSGVVLVDDTYPLIKRAIIIYCKTHFGYDNPEATRLADSYNMLKTGLSLAEEYNAYTITFTVTSGGLPVDGATVTINESDVGETNSLGVVVFTTLKKGFDIDYTVTADGYVDVAGSVYVDGNEAVGVVLVAA